MKNSLKKIKAFTLAEVLITLGIVGVVAALTLPNIILEHKAKKLRSQYFKQLAILNHVWPLVLEEEDPFSVYDKNYYNYPKFFAKHIKGAEVNKLGRNHRNLLGEGTNIYPIGYNTAEGVLSSPFGYWMFCANSACSRNKRSIVVSVDINGYNNKPNRFGYDIFAFYLNGDGSVEPVGDSKNPTAYCNYDKKPAINAKGNSNGWGCSYRAIHEENYFKNLVKNVKY